MLNPNAKHDLAAIDRIMTQIRQNQKRPGSTPLTSEQMRRREDRRHNMAVSIRMNGGTIKRDYKDGRD